MLERSHYCDIYLRGESTILVEECRCACETKRYLYIILQVDSTLTAYTKSQSNNKVRINVRKGRANEGNHCFSACFGASGSPSSLNTSSHLRALSHP